MWEFYARKTLDADQRLAVELMLAESADGRWAADTTGRAESRQNGKGDEIEVVELWGTTQRAEAILHTAHEAATAASAHGRMIALVEGHRDLRSKIKKKQSWNGNYSLVLTNDAVIVWRTRTGAGGRGLDDISRIVIDEAQHAQPEELASSLPILSVNPNPQKNFIGSGGITGKSAFWWRQRRRALTGGADRFAWLEHSAEKVAVDEAGRIVSLVGDVADPATWKQANPAYPSRISHDFLLDQLETLGPELFAREHLCVWDPEPDAAPTVIPPEAWSVCGREGVTPEGQVAYALDVSPDGHSAAIAASDGIRVLVAQHGPGTGWVVDALLELAAAHKGPLYLDPKGPAGALLPNLTAAGIDATLVTPGEHAQACGALLVAAVTGELMHARQTALDAAVAGATRRPYGDSWAWSRRTSQVDISPLVAVTIAKWGATTMTSSHEPFVVFA